MQMVDFRVVKVKLLVHRRPLCRDLEWCSRRGGAGRAEPSREVIKGDDDDEEEGKGREKPAFAHEAQHDLQQLLSALSLCSAREKARKANPFPSLLQAPPPFAHPRQPPLVSDSALLLSVVVAPCLQLAGPLLYKTVSLAMHRGLVQGEQSAGVHITLIIGITASLAAKGQPNGVTVTRGVVIGSSCSRDKPTGKGPTDRQKAGR